MMNHHNILIQAYFSNYFRVHLNNKHVHGPRRDYINVLCIHASDVDSSKGRLRHDTCFEKDASKRFSAGASRISFGGCNEIKLLSINVNR